MLPASPLHLGPHRVDPPVVLAPMAGITGSAFRRLCRELSGTSGGLYVSEMVTSRALVERDAETLRMVTFHPEESRPGMVRSVQLYGVDPRTVGEAVRIVVGEGRADHVDLNFGCPVPKVTRKGGGSALPYKRPLLRAILREAVAAADGVPVTVKMRKGIDDEHLTYLDAGAIAQEEGVAWVALHGRTAVQHYSGQADWDAIAVLKRELDVPVLGNGDVWSAADALRMTARTGCDGVVVGRGCLGRPWLFAQLATAFRGEPLPADPDLRGVAAVMVRHAELLTEELGEDKGVRDLRKHVAWYLKGFAVGSDLRRALAMVRDLDELRALLDRLDLDQPYPVAVLDAPRGRTTAQKRVALPEGWLDDPYDAAVPAGAELVTSGG
ncbi:tRNA dihydrouridine synthase DusB [Vallicoccus soli]|uniref:tRNA-dihydrouridine synthase n=1 Tax=Vallicoccus soli TaxID=2339232 RepID=A0A3A3Z1G9_9ACTN|nr:tRNA dihydrouridine synthase DusB [Vallicoccus soli]RJK97023.1 tRNA dihydrouridine synthase DusB [Vallicoccus soli]